jgi:hypothetical protein
VADHGGGTGTIFFASTGDLLFASVHLVLKANIIQKFKKHFYAKHTENLSTIALMPSFVLNSVTSIPVKMSMIRTALVTKLICESGKLHDLTTSSNAPIIEQDIRDSPPNFKYAHDLQRNKENKTDHSRAQQCGRQD